MFTQLLHRDTLTSTPHLFNGSFVTVYIRSVKVTSSKFLEASKRGPREKEDEKIFNFNIIINLDIIFNEREKNQYFNFQLCKFTLSQLFIYWRNC